MWGREVELPYGYFWFVDQKFRSKHGCVARLCCRGQLPPRQHGMTDIPFQFLILCHVGWDAIFGGGRPFYGRAVPDFGNPVRGVGVSGRWSWGHPGCRRFGAILGHLDVRGTRCFSIPE